jgi:23S rRNA (uracil747-C5)-methyltransferase
MKTICGYYNKSICNSCDLISLDYPAQIQIKEELLLKELDGITHPPLIPTEISFPTGFRNKAKFVVTGSLTNPVIGLWGEKDLDLGRELLECPLHLAEINLILPALKEFIRLAKLKPYQIASKTGELKGIILFHSKTTGETYLRFVLRSKESVDRIKKNVMFLTSQFKNIKCISVNIQPIAHALLEGEEEIFITDQTTIQNLIGSFNFSLSPRAFVQTNQDVADKLYQTAAFWIKETGLTHFMELFCGQGAFSFFCAPYVKKGLGVEINSEAVAEANRIKNKYGFDHLDFKCADAGKVNELIEEFKPSIILVNPPRRGLGEASKLIVDELPEMIIYSSCNYESLVKDLRELEKYYEITKLQIFDMFPNSKHFETLVSLRKNKTIHNF